MIIIVFRIITFKNSDNIKYYGNATYMDLTNQRLQICPVSPFSRVLSEIRHGGCEMSDEFESSQGEKNHADSFPPLLSNQTY